MPSQNDPEKTQLPLMENLLPISTVLNSLQISGSTPNNPDLNSSTTGGQLESQWQTGRPPSEIVLGNLRNIAQSVLQGKLLDDQILQTLLEQHFGSSRFTSRAKLKHVYGSDGGYDCSIDSYDIELDKINDSEMKLYDAIEFLNRPASKEFVTKQIARLRTVMARKAESNEDLVILLDTYADHLIEFPPDVVKAVCDYIIENTKWFPLISEMRKKMHDLVRFRKNLMTCFEEKRNPLLANRAEQKKLQEDPRLQEHWKNLKRSEWLPQHYDWSICEVDAMIALAKSNPVLSLSDWEEKRAKLVQQKSEAYP